MSFAFCTVAAAPLRKEPNHRAEMTSQLLFGDALQRLEQQQEWIWIKSLYDGYEGWLTEHLITVLDERTASAPAPVVTTGLLNPVRYADELFQLPMGCTLPGYDAETRQLWDSRYIFDGACRDTKTTGSKALLRRTIQPWLHAPYLWGGRTFLGVDCSGFVQTVFKIAGVPLLRDAWQQAAQGALVEGPAQEGDVAFFKNESGKIVHVGIVLPDAKIIHAAGTVRIDTLTGAGIVTAAGKQTHYLHSVKRMIDWAIEQESS